MTAEERDAEEVEETPQEDKPKRRRLRGRSKQTEEAAAEPTPDAGDEPKAKSKSKAKSQTKKAKPEAKAKAEGESKPEAKAKPQATADPEVAPEAKPRPKRKAKPKAEAASPVDAGDTDGKDAPPARTDEPETADPGAEPEPDEVPQPAAATEEKDEPPARAREAPARRSTGPDGAPALVRARARYVRTSARKARLVSDHIRGKSVDEARAILAFAPRAVARDWSKLLESAVANAEHNHELVGDELRVKDVYADEGPTLKRYRPRAMGRATRIRKRTSHLTITLAPRDGDARSEPGRRQQKTGRQGPRRS